jgi:hypothetical protein
MLCYRRARGTRDSLGLSDIVISTSVWLLLSIHFVDLTDEEKDKHSRFGYVKYEAYPESKPPIIGRYWAQKDLDSINNGCGTVTRMGKELSETYARDPQYYGSTFCCGCCDHLPIREFTWEGTNERVGS